MIKKLIFVAACLFSAVNLQAQQTYPSWIQYIPPAGSYTGGAVTNPFLAPDGTCGAPGFAFNSDADGTGHGLYRINSTNTGWCLNGVEVYRFASTTWQTTSTFLGLGSSVGAPDVHYGRRAAAVPVTNLGGSTFSLATNSVTIGGVLCISSATAATTGTTEEVLATCTLPANAFNTNGRAIRIKAWGSSAANGNTKLMRIRFGGIGGTTISQRSFVTASHFPYVEAIVLRTGASAQIAFGESGSGAENSSSTAQQNRSSPTSDTTAAIDIVITGHTATAAGDLTLTGFMVEFLN